MSVACVYRIGAKTEVSKVRRMSMRQPNLLSNKIKSISRELRIMKKELTNRSQNNSCGEYSLLRLLMPTKGVSMFVLILFLALTMVDMTWSETLFLQRVFLSGAFISVFIIGTNVKSQFISCPKDTHSLRHVQEKPLLFH